MDQFANKDLPIIIIGAGAAGLMAARELSEKGLRPVILEAADRPGGRIRTLRDTGFLHPVEAGAEFVHGKLPYTFSLIKQSGVSFRPVKGKMMHVEKGKWVPRQGIDEQWEEMLQKMQELKEDIPLARFMELHLEDKKYAGLRESVKGFAEGFDLADIETVSTFFLRREWMHEEHEQFRIKGGYGKLIDWLATQCREAGCQLHTRSVVKKIDWEKGRVRVHTAGGEVYTGCKLVITASLGVLLAEGTAEAAFRFVPAIDKYLAAAGKIGFGGVLKVLLQFKQPFQKKELGKAGFIICDKGIRTWWTQAPDNNPLLTGWLGGSRLKEYDQSTPEAIMDTALDSLRPVTALEKSAMRVQLTAWKVINWAKEPFSLGAYSFDMPETPAARELLTTPVEDTLFFAGEALYDGASPGTVEAAFNSGAKVAARILRSYSFDS
ncbi:MAG: NAD(P)/FAD-dependent oxidoreductase [Puia sp.]|nr:NAD(P)/FAD-dependent oxidoreductase [Puia sp.]